MELMDIKEIVHDEIKRVMDRHFKHQYCPSCMLKFSAEYKGDGEDDYIYKVKYRCLNCLKVFTEQLKEEND